MRASQAREAGSIPVPRLKKSLEQSSGLYFLLRQKRKAQWRFDPDIIVEIIGTVFLKNIYLIIVFL